MNPLLSALSRFANGISSDSKAKERCNEVFFFYQFLFPYGSPLEEFLSHDLHFPFYKLSGHEQEKSMLLCWRCAISSYPAVLDYFSHEEMNKYTRDLDAFLVEKFNVDQQLLTQHERYRLSYLKMYATHDQISPEEYKQHQKQLWILFSQELCEKNKEQFEHYRNYWFLIRDLNEFKNLFERGKQNYTIAKISMILGCCLNELSLNSLIGALIFKPFEKEINQLIENHSQISTKFSEENERIQQNLNCLNQRFSLQQHKPPKEKVFTIDCPHNVEKAMELAVLGFDDALKNKEHCEVHRWGLFNQPFLSGSFFQEAIILKNTGPLPNSKNKEQVYQAWQNNDFYYFDNNQVMPRDLDTLGAFLCLLDQVPRKLYETFDPILAKHFSQHERLSIWLEHKSSRYVQNICQHHCDLIFLRFFTGYLKHKKSFKTNLMSFINGYLDQLIARGFIINHSYKQSYESLLISEFLKTSEAFLTEGFKEKIQNLINFNLDCTNSLIDSVFAVLSMSALNINTDEIKQKITDLLLASQGPDGLWQSQDFFIMPNHEGSLTYYSSKSVTTSFCLRALKELHHD